MKPAIWILSLACAAWCVVMLAYDSRHAAQICVGLIFLVCFAAFICWQASEDKK